MFKNIIYSPTQDVELGSRKIQIESHKQEPLTEENVMIDCKTPGSVNLILQSLLPGLLACNKQKETITLNIRGGTFVSFSPTALAHQKVLLPLLRKMGVQLEYSILSNGLTPVQMGEVEVKIQRRDQTLKPLIMLERGILESVTVYISMRYTLNHLMWNRKTDKISSW